MTAAINLFHILVVVPAIFWIYYHRKNLPTWVCTALIVVGFAGLLYHSYMLCNLTKETRWKEWILLSHIFIIFPLFIYIGSKCSKTERKWFEISLLLAFAALGYHSFNLVKYSVLEQK